jgi:thiol-disulfide isomerase/thioredoxin
MRIATTSLALLFVITPAIAQQRSDRPSDDKAQKTYQHALDALHDRRPGIALDEFKKADKQDGGRCFACQKQMIKYGVELGEWKTAEQAAEEMVAEAQSEQDKALGHYQCALVFMQEGLQRHKDEYFTRAHQEVSTVLAAFPKTPGAVLLDGKVLAQLKQDEEAKAKFEQFVKMKSADDAERQRALRYIERPELARARMAPPFTVTTTDGQRVSMDDLQGKVVLVDFWATWCGPCREALPHMQNVARKFRGQPLVILSVSLDSDEQKWKDFIVKNEMTWPQYRDGGFTGPIARMFNVTAIPHTFTIDTDGVLQEEHIGDASIEGKLKKLLVHARELTPSETLSAN